MHGIDTWAVEEQLLIKDMGMHSPQLALPDLVKVGAHIAAHSLAI